MQTVTTLPQLTQNLKRLEHYLHAGSSDDKEEARRFIQRGTCFLAYDDAGTLRFAPSRFIGYENNTFDKHSGNNERDGRVTNPAISKLLKTPLPLVDAELDEKYQQYCHSLGIIPRLKGAFGVSRKYWKM